MELPTLLFLGVVGVIVAVATAFLWARARHNATQTDRVTVTPSVQGANVACATAPTGLAPAPYEPLSFAPPDVIGASDHKDVAAKSGEVSQQVALDLQNDAEEMAPSTVETTDEIIDANIPGAAATDFSGPDASNLNPSGHDEEPADCFPVANNDIEQDADADQSCKVDDAESFVAIPTPVAELHEFDAGAATPAEEPALVEDESKPTETTGKKKRTTVYRDQRGKRRAKAQPPTPPTETAPPPLATIRTPAEARLRLTLHTIRKTATLTIVLSRPDGYPESITPIADGHGPLDAYDEGRYDDLEIPWTSDLLNGEIRIQCAEGFHWLRASRRVHIFVSDPSEAGLVATGSARAGMTHTIVCPQEDASSVISCCEQTGSSPPAQLDRWNGIPHGWCILTDFRPVHAPTTAFPSALQTLNPGTGTEITLGGGLSLRGNVYAEGHPPRIHISALSAEAVVSIDGSAATQHDGAWSAAGWDQPGQHMIDIVPGPSLSYEITADPARGDGWGHFDGHPNRFLKPSDSPWASATVCGAVTASSTGACLFAIEPCTAVGAIGALDGAAALVQRLDVPVSAGFLPFWPAFIVCTSGMRRAHGRVMWLGIRDESSRRRKADPHWVAIVRSATARHLPLDTVDAAGLLAWQNAKKRARRQRRSTR